MGNKPGLFSMPLDGISALVVVLHEEYLPKIFLVFYDRFYGVRH
jgi:hypothetical protein